MVANAASGRSRRPSHDQFVRPFAEYRLSSAISFAAAFGGRTPLVTISRFSSFLPERRVVVQILAQGRPFQSEAGKQALRSPARRNRSAGAP